MGADRIVLVGLSGSGKSTVGHELARRLGWDFVDTDAAVAEQAGRSIPDLFRDEGEPAFRAREQEALTAAMRRSRVVVATGGGAPTTVEGRRAIGEGFAVWLVISPAAAASRLSRDPMTETRPLLGGDPAARLAVLLEDRQRYYELADAAVDVEALDPEHVAEEIIRLWHEAGGRDVPKAPRFGVEPTEAMFGPPVVAVVRTGAATCPIVVQAGAIEHLGDFCREAGLRGRAFVLTDANVGPLFAAAALGSLQAADIPAASFEIPAGEEQKNLGTVSAVYDWLLGERVERSDFVVCLGGGVVTDLGGYAAATTLRGLPFVHVPTTLLGMVDASVGGKTGVDHPRGKNLIGAFAQPRAVVIDPRVLESLPARQRRAGWAEVIKHGLILDEPLVADLERGAGDPASMLSPGLIGRSVAIKAGVVSEDEREAGRRTLLNYGHTIGHAIEAVTGYSDYLHGEAVAIGMHAAGLISAELGLLRASALDRQQALIRAYGLPETGPGLDPAAVLAATQSDKKVRAGRIQWVVLAAIGDATTRDGVPDAVVRNALETVLR
ncbi:MAG: 3-dehydroquinate synthase [Chloroflexi bacterium]|nr:3-dehydroquinate synthase [Chloroflexota bacterium]